MLVGCLLVDHFPFYVEAQRHPELRDRPALIVQREGSRGTVVDHAPAVKGVHPGMSLQQALAQRGDAVLIAADQACYQAAFEELLDALEQRSPVVEPDGLGRAYIDLEGLAALYGGEARLCASLLDAVRPPIASGRLGVAPGKFPACVAALQARPGNVFRVAEPVAESLKAAPVDLLPVPWPVRERLHRFGLRTLQDVAAIGVGPLQAQFGPEGRLIAELARGEDRRPLLPRQREEAVTASLTFPSPAASLEAMASAADSLLERLFGKALRGRLARVCTLEGRIFRAPSWQRRIAFREPLGDRGRAFLVVKHALINHSPPGPLEDLTVALSGLTGEAGRQESLWTNVRRRQQLQEALRQLEAQMGSRRTAVYQVREVEPWSRIPERRWALTPYAF